MNKVYTMELPDLNKKTIFLAGPTRRINENFDGVVSSWRDDAIAHLERIGFDGNVCIPEFKNGVKPENWSYGKQIDWEVEHLVLADVILFWIPRDLKELPAFTTNIEFGEWMKSGKISIGAPDDAPKNDYIKYRCKLLKIPFFNNLKDVCAYANMKIKMEK